MHRTFHSRMTIGTLCGIILLAVATLTCFLNRSTIGIICGLVLLVAAVAATEKALHTEYRITGEGTLTVYKGRFAKTRQLSLKQIQQIEKIHTSFGLSHFLLLRLDNGKNIILQPDNEDAFISQIQKFRNT